MTEYAAIFIKKCTDALQESLISEMNQHISDIKLKHACEVDELKSQYQTSLGKIENELDLSKQQNTVLREKDTHTHSQFLWLVKRQQRRTTQIHFLAKWRTQKIKKSLLARESKMADMHYAKSIARKAVKGWQQVVQLHWKEITMNQMRVLLTNAAEL